MNTAKKLMLGMLRGSGAATDPTASFTVTTTGAQTLTITTLTVSASTTVDWGDGSSNAYTGIGARTHDYAGAGTWTVRILEPLNVTQIGLLDTKITALQGAQISKMVNLTYIYLQSLSGLSWTVGASAPMPTGLTDLTLRTLSGLSWTVGASAPMPTGLKVMYLRDMDGLSWTVGASAPMPTGLTYLNLYNLPGVTWTVGAAAPMPTGLTYLYLYNLSGLTAISTGLETLTEMTTFTYENNLTTANVNAVLANLWAGFATRTVANGTIDLLGLNNLGPTGPVAAENPPTYGGAYVHELVNDTGGVNPTHKWLSASTATPV